MCCCVHIKKAISLENHSDITAKSCLRKKVQCKCNYDYKLVGIICIFCLSNLQPLKIQRVAFKYGSVFVCKKKWEENQPVEEYCSKE